MKNLSIIIIGLAFFSCDTRLDHRLEINEKPTFKIRSTNDWSINSNKTFKTILNDSLKLGNEYEIEYSVTDDNESILLEKKDNLNSSLLYNFVPNDIQSVKVGKGDLIISAGEIGFHQIKLEVTDQFENKHLNELNLTVFKNIIPVAEFSITENTNSNNPKEYIFNASSSYDQDAKFGGKIDQYIYEISNTQTNFSYTLPSNLKITPYLFPDTGTYSVSLRTIDNNSGQSVIKNKTVIVTP